MEVQLALVAVRTPPRRTLLANRLGPLAIWGSHEKLLGHLDCQGSAGRQVGTLATQSPLAFQWALL